MGDVLILPLVDWIGPTPVYHGERGADLDPVHPEACLCGKAIYWMCDGPGIESMTFHAVTPPEENPR